MVPRKLRRANADDAATKIQFDADAEANAVKANDVAAAPAD